MKTLSFGHASLVILLLISSTFNSYAANAPWVEQSFKGGPCRGGNQGYGPFDYTIKHSLPTQNLRLVESAHFTYQVENLIKGNAGNLVSDLDYTLRAWPNHHRALNSISRYQLLFSNRKKTLSPVECYFHRAIRFSPNDATTRMLFGIFLHKTKHYKMALEQYNKATELSPKNPIIRYNYGLLLFHLKKYQQAQQQAVIAYGANFPLNGLKNKLKRVKFWPPRIPNTPRKNTKTAPSK